MRRTNIVALSLLASMLGVCMVQAATPGRTAGSFGVGPSGAATYSIPIYAPPGPNGLQPGIALVYNSQAGGGAVGVGWGISGLSSISRCGSTYAQDGAPAPVALTYADRFCLDGQRLRLTSSEDLSTYGHDLTTYQTEIANFSIVTAHGATGNGPSTFTVRAKNGATYEYGNGANSQVQLAGTASAWMLDKITDRAGNTLTVSYLAPSGSLVGSTLPDTISWTPTTHAGTTYAYTMKFSYMATTSAQQAGYMAGGQTLVSNKLLGIVVNNGATVIKNYVFAYTNSNTTGRLELQSVKECADSAASNCLAPTSMTYQGPAVGLTTPRTDIGSGATNGALRSADIDGDGKADFVFARTNSNGTYEWWVQLSTGSGFGSPIDTGASSAGPSLLLLDSFDGKAGNELLAPSGANWSVYKYNPASHSFTGTPTGAAVVAGAIYASADVDGDGLPDLVYVKSVFDGKVQAQLNTLQTTGSVAFGAVGTTTVPISSCSSSCVSLFAGNNQVPYSPIRKFDFDGDGRQDLILAISNSGSFGAFTLQSRGVTGFVNKTVVSVADSAESVVPVNWNDDACTDLVVGKAVYVSQCNGVTAQIVTLPTFPFMAIDWDGDGRTDLIVATNGGGMYTLYESTGTGVATISLPAFSIGGGVNVMDVDGDGLDDVACSCGTGNAVNLSFHNGAGQPPDLLTSITDGQGNSSSPTYVSIAQSHYVPATDAVFPNQSFVRPLSVVSQVTYSDPSSATAGATYSSSYSYAGGWLNLQGRSFQGFYSMASVDSRTIALAPPNGLTETRYFERTFPYAGMMFEDTVSNGTFALSDSVGTLPATPLTLDPNANGFNQRYFAYFSNRTVTRREFGGAENSQQVSTSSTTYDAPTNGYGDIPKITQVVTDNDPGSPYKTFTWTTVTTNTWTTDTSQSCALLNHQVTAYTATDGGLPVTRTKSFTPDTTACNYTQMITEPSSATYKVTEDLLYDTFGNVKSDTVTGIGMAPRATGIVYNATGQFPATVTNALNQATTLTFDSSWGQPATSSDPNGLQTQWFYDAFGRKNKEIRPDQTATQWTVSDCASSGGCLFGSHGLVTQRTDYNVDNSVLTDATDYFDAVNRPLVSIQRMLAAGAYSRNESRYDSLGNISFQAAPCAWSTITVACPAGTTFTHDVLGRVTQAQLSGANPSTYAYSGRTLTVTDPNGHSKTAITDVNGRLRQTKDANGYAVTLSYDAAGGQTGTSDSQGRTLASATLQYGITAFATQVVDLSMGTWGYTFDALGETTAWSDSNGHTFSASYDALSRPHTRSEPDLYTQWTWGSSAASANIGSLQSVCTGTGTLPTACSASGYSESESYDGKGRLAQRTIVLPGAGSFVYGYQYNPNTGLPSTMSYPVSTSGYALQLQYGYGNGMLQSVTDVADSPNVTLWTANSVNPAGQTTQETLGNAVVVNRSFDAANHWLNSVTAGVNGGAALENLSYLHDAVGNLTLRQENNLGLNESFFYDNLNRLYYSQLSSTQSGTATNLQLCFDNVGAACTENLPGMGQITAKTADPNLPVSYTAHWTSYNYPDSIASSGESVTFAYGPDRQRWQQNYNNGAEVTNYVGPALEQVVTAAGTDFRHYVYAGSKPVAILSRKSSGANAWNFLLSDHQGGVAAIISSSGTLEVSESFTAYGARRNGTTWAGPASSADLTTIAGLTREGYQFQTALGQALGLNHMNGRVQDPGTGQFLSPDPAIPDPSNTQDYNRYAYVDNNPLTLTDPSGFDPCGTSAASSSTVGGFTTSDADFVSWLMGSNYSDASGRTSPPDGMEFASDQFARYPPALGPCSSPAQQNPDGFISSMGAYQDGYWFYPPCPGCGYVDPDGGFVEVVASRAAWMSTTVSYGDFWGRGLMSAASGSGGGGSPGGSQNGNSAPQGTPRPCTEGPSTASGSVSGEFYAGPGGGIKAGVDDGHPFVTARVGFGAGGGLSYNPKGGMAITPGSPNMGGTLRAVTGKGGVAFGIPGTPIAISINVELGVAYDSNSGFGWVHNFDPEVGASAERGFHADASVGGQVTAYGQSPTVYTGHGTCRAHY